MILMDYVKANKLSQKKYILLKITQASLHSYKNKMFPRTNNRKAISTVLTTMIILVASVVLGTGVVIYGTSLFQTGAQQEAITTQGVTIWVNGTDQNGVSWGAAGVRNSGDKLVSVDSIQIRGASVPFTQWWVDKNQTRVSADNYQSQYIMTKMQTSLNRLENTSPNTTTPCPGGTNFLEIDFDKLGSKPTLCLNQASGPISLTPGQKMIVYFRVNPGLLAPVDSGSSTSVSIFAGKTGAPTSVTVGNP